MMYAGHLAPRTCVTQHVTPHCTSHCTLHCVPQVFVKLDEDLDIVHATQASRTTVSAQRRLRSPKNQCTAATSLKKFCAQHREAADDRIKSMSTLVKTFEHNSQVYMPSGWQSTPLSVAGMNLLNLSEPKTMRQVKAICKKKEILPPSGFVRSHSFHYGKYERFKLVSLLSISVMKMNNVPGSITVSIDIAASTDKNHSMTIALDSAAPPSF